MKIIQAVYGDASGGRWQAMLNTYDALASKGHEGMIVYGSENQTQKKEAYHSFCLNSSGFYDVIAAIKLALWLRQYRPDIIIAHSGRAVYLFKNALFFARLSCPVLAMNHSHNVKRTVRADGFLHITPQVKWCVAEASRKKGVDVDRKPQAIISNLIHLPEYQPSFDHVMQSPLVLGIMTRLVDYKGTHLAIDAVKQLKDKGYKIQLLIAGEGDQKEILMKQTHDLELEQDVIFLGWLGGTAKKAFYQRVDIVVVPTMNDTQPLAILDAFAWGKAIIGSDHISVQQIIRHEENGLMAKCGDAKALAQCVELLILNPVQQFQLAQQGYQEAINRYAFAAIAEQLDQFIHQVKLVTHT